MTGCRYAAANAGSLLLVPPVQVEDVLRIAMTASDIPTASYFPYMAVYILFTSPASFEKADRDWGRVATLPASGPSLKQ
jgi:hypothetical protein